MIQNVFETNPGEASALLSGKLLVYVLLLGLAPAVLIWRWPVAYRPFFRGLLNKVLVIVVCVLVIGASVGAFYSTYAPIFRQEDKLTHFINPTNYIYAISKYAKQRLGIKKHFVVQAIGEDAVMSVRAAGREKKTLMVFVVGETARADHFSLNGYERETNPELSRLDILNFTGVHSCGTSTAVSVPCMFSMFPREDYSDKKGKTYEGLLDVLQRAGVQVLWLDNNSDCKGTCLRVPNRDIDKHQPGPFCDGNNCLDEALLADLQGYIDSLKGHAIIVLHADGSHGPEYFKRYPKEYEHFTPVCESNALNNCSRESIVNGYDNTLVYTDHVLSSLIDVLRSNQEKVNTAMLYLSDHGESLGEYNLFLHGTPYMLAPEQQKHVAMLAWFSDSYQKSYSVDTHCLQMSRDKPLSQDNLFHSMLGLLEVQSKVYQHDLDLFAGCRGAVIEGGLVRD